MKTALKKEVFGGNHHAVSPLPYASSSYDMNPYSLMALSETKRLIFYGGSRKDDEVFFRASQNTNNDYLENDNVKEEDTHKITTGKGIVDVINSQKLNSVQSIDFFSHSGRENLYFKKGVNDLYRDKSIQRSSQLFKRKSASLDEINFDVFTNNAKIEFHGCNTASFEEGYDDDTFAQYFSRKLQEAGKEKAVVIGHMTQANPNGHKTLSGDDYRHGRRRVFHNGEVLFYTSKEGRLTPADINRYLTKKENEGDLYDGRNEFLKE